MTGQLDMWAAMDADTQMLIAKPIRLIELFAGIGAQAKALETLGVPFEHYRTEKKDMEIRIVDCFMGEVDSYNGLEELLMQDFNIDWKVIVFVNGKRLGVYDLHKHTFVD